MRAASSELATFGCKTGLIVFCIPFTLVTVILTVRAEQDAVWFGIATCLLWVHYIWFWRRVVFVSVDDTTLLAKRWGRTIEVPWQSIARVKQIRWIRGHPFQIEFQTETAFGQRVFMLLPLRRSKREPILEIFRKHTRVIEE